MILEGGVSFISARSTRLLFAQWSLRRTSPTAQGFIERPPITLRLVAREIPSIGTYPSFFFSSGVIFPLTFHDTVVRSSDHVLIDDLILCVHGQDGELPAFNIIACILKQVAVKLVGRGISNVRVKSSVYRICRSKDTTNYFHQ